MTLATLTAAVAAGIDTKTLFSVRAPKLEIGQDYVMTAWTGKGKTARAVTFLGAGAAVDDLEEKNPRVKDLTEGQFYFFKTLDVEGKSETVAAFGHDGVLCVGIEQTKDEMTASIPTRVTFFSETAPTKATSAPKDKKEKAAPAVDAEVVDAETGVTEA